MQEIEIGGIVIFTENITERKKAEQTIKESEERFGQWQMRPRFLFGLLMSISKLPI
jgi:sensor histidine kinase YesM